jgi:hypothetical protein
MVGMSCWCECMYNFCNGYFGSQVSRCKSDFDTGNVKDIAICLAQTFAEQPEIFLPVLVKQAASCGISCLLNDKDKKELYDHLIFVCGKYKMLVPEEVNKLMIKTEPKQSILGKITNIFKK